jgi:hypothetical protein
MSDSAKLNSASAQAGASYFRDYTAQAMVNGQSSCSGAANAPSPKDTQVGGSHYKDMPIQPVEFITKNKIPYCEANIIKYATRHRSKGGAQDVRKIIHYAQLILELEYGEKP